MAPSQHLVGFLPNLHLRPDRVLSVGPLSLCSADANVMRHVRASAGNATGRKMLRRFRTTFGESFKPACLLSTTGTVDAAAVRDFRNLVAMSAISIGTASTLTGGQWLVRRSDHFTFFHFGPARNGWLTTFDGLSQGIRELGAFQGASLASVGNPDNFRCRLDEPLLKTLLWAWAMLHEKKRHVTRLQRFFRSLEVAFQAGRFPSDGLTTVNDVGTRVGLWVSAFEILLRPPTGKVDKVSVQRALSTADWCKRELTRRRYRIKQRGITVHVGLPTKLYDLLYDARNTFLHGNPLRGRPLEWNRGDRVVSLEMVAPCLFAAGIRVALRGLAPPPGDYDEMLGLDQLGAALLPQT